MDSSGPRRETSCGKTRRETKRLPRKKPTGILSFLSPRRCRHFRSRRLHAGAQAGMPVPPRVAAKSRASACRRVVTCALVEAACVKNPKRWCNAFTGLTTFPGRLSVDPVGRAPLVYRLLCVLPKHERSVRLRHGAPTRDRARSHQRKATGGEGGIRTPGSFRPSGFQDRRDRPLCHLSD